MKKIFAAVLVLSFIASCSFSEGRIEIHGQENEVQGRRVVLVNKSSEQVISFTVKKEETTYALKEREDMSGERVGETVESTSIYTLNPGQQRKIGVTWSKPVFRKVLVKREYSIVGEVVKD